MQTHSRVHLQYLPQRSFSVVNLIGRNGRQPQSILKVYLSPDVNATTCKCRYLPHCHFPLRRMEHLCQIYCTRTKKNAPTGFLEMAHQKLNGALKYFVSRNTGNRISWHHIFIFQSVFCPLVKWPRCSSEMEQ